MKISEDEYLEIEEALSGLARGRAFLRMRDQRARVIALDEARRLVRSVKDTVRRQTAEPDAGAHIRILRQELQEMATCIEQTRSEIAALRPQDAGSSRIMEATGELGAIVTATERATSEILTAAERIQELVAQLPRDPANAPVVTELESNVIEILTACSFQDITGQRTNKVVNTLRYLERRVNAMVEIWGVEGMARPPGSERPQDGDLRPDAHLLNGPSSDGVSQSDVDALLATLEPKAADAKPAAMPIVAQVKREPLAAAPVTKPTEMAPAAATIDQSAIDALFN